VSQGVRRWLPEDAPDPFADPVGAQAFASDLEERRQPALERLSRDHREHREALLDGFNSRADVLAWLVSVTGATLGRLPEELYDAIHADMVAAAREEATPLVGALLDRPDAVEGLEPRVVRARLAASTLAPAHSKAIRALRDDAQEHAPGRSGEEAPTKPHRERHVAMRPSLSAIERHQQQALVGLLAGFQDLSAILRWGDVLELACHGTLPSNWIADAVNDPAMRRVLLAGGDGGHPDPPVHRRAREAVAARLCGRFRAGTRARYDHAAETSDRETESRSKTM
jgi:hypothetical protein